MRRVVLQGPGAIPGFLRKKQEIKMASRRTKILVLAWRVHTRHRKGVVLLLLLGAAAFLANGNLIAGGVAAASGVMYLGSHRKEWRKKGGKEKPLRGVVVPVCCPHCKRAWEVNTLMDPGYVGNAQECKYCGEIFVPREPGTDEYMCKECRYLWKIEIGGREPDKCPSCGSGRIENYTNEIDQIIIEEKRKRLKGGKRKKRRGN
jgi:hypothetical protein